MRFWLSVFCLCLLLRASAQQDLAVSGRVLDRETGKPIVGATVSLQRNGLVTATDALGHYTLLPKLAGRDSLMVRDMQYAIYSTLLLLQGTIIHDVLMEPRINTLEVVQVNTGYQQMQRRAATGAVELISSADMAHSTSGQLLDRIDGLFSGGYMNRRSQSINSVQLSPKLTIRGESRVWGESPPLIVLDNFPFEGNIATINPEEIESITVLKDAAAAAIWGVRAGNGVIVISTKKGRLNQPLAIEADSHWKTSQKPDLFSDQIVTSSEFIDMEVFLFGKGFYDRQIRDRRKPVLTPVVKLLIAHRDGDLDAQELEDALGVYRKRDVRHDFLNYVYRPQLESNSNISFRGGGDKATYGMTLGYNENRYNMPMNRQDRLSIRLNQSYKPFAKLTIATDLSFVHLLTQRSNASPAGGYEQIRINSKKLYPYAQLKDTDGNNAVLRHQYDESFITANQGLVARNWDFVPLDELERNPEKTENQQVIAGLNLDYRLLSGLRLSLNSQLNRSMSDRNLLREEDSYFVRNLYNRFTAIKNGETSYALPDGGMQTYNNSKQWGYALRGQLDLQRQFAVDHQLYALLGAESREQRNSSRTGLNYGVYAERNAYQTVDFTKPYPLFPAIGGQAYLADAIQMSGTQNRYVSFYGNMNYAFKERYRLSLSARNDASNIFGVATRNKWSPLWSIGGAWELSKESFFGLAAFNYLKLRSSFGYSGNVDNQQSAELILRQSSELDAYTNQPFMSVVSLENPYLRWEKVETLNMGLDASLWGNALNISLDYYRKISKDLLRTADVDPTLGVISVINNSAILGGRGLDMSLASRLKKGDWSWQGILKAGYNKTVLKKMLDKRTGPASSDLYSGVYEGKEYRTVFSYRWAGLSSEDGRAMGHKDGELSTDYRSIIRETKLEDFIQHGPSIPRASLSLRNRIGFKQLELAFTLGGQFAYFFRKKSIDYGLFVNRWIGHADFRDRWQEPGDELKTDVPAFIYPLDGNHQSFYTNSEALVRAGDHLRLQDVRLSYRWATPPKRLGLRSLECFLYANNLGLIWTKNKERVDPVLNGAIPLPITLTAGLNLKF